MFGIIDFIVRFFELFFSELRFMFERLRCILCVIIVSWGWGYKWFLMRYCENLWVVYEEYWRLIDLVNWKNVCGIWLVKVMVKWIK